MPKLLWVLLPVLTAGALLGWQLLRRRPPSRHALNIGFSLLLLAYLATTAGLGIFWVANQQLPVFDWHYLFGYATLLLVALHLGFNGRIVWRYFTRPRTASPPRAAAHRPPRRRAFGLALGALAAGAAYWLGLRHGRDAVPPLARSADEAPAPSALAAVERYHQLSSNSRRGVLRVPGFDWGQAPAAFKPAATDERVALPPPGGAVTGRFDLTALSTLLWHCAGISGSAGQIRLRASPSSGALFPTELYVAARDVAGLAPGLWHYDPLAHALTPVARGAAAAAAPAAVAEVWPPQPAALVLATAVFQRSGHKYRDRCWRYVLADLGHALENLRATARATGLHAHFAMRFDEARCAAALQLHGVDEAVLALLALHPHARMPAGDTPLPDLDWRSAAAVQPHPLGITGAMHAASSLHAAPGGMAAPVRRSPPPVAADVADAIPLPRPVPVRSEVTRIIAARRSVRRFADEALPLSALSAVLAALAASPRLLPAQPLIVDVVVHAVDGLAPGTYRHDPQQHALLPRRTGSDLRRAARAAALDQDVIGDAAVVFVLSMPRSALLDDAAGPARAYRHALLHAGSAGERIYLEAGARGLGCCAVGAFYDDEAAALIGADPAREWVLHFAALGRPAA
jgi:SagB-type dehydrogenase family enzyme